MLSPCVERTRVRIMPCVLSRSSLTLAGSIGFEARPAASDSICRRRGQRLAGNDVDVDAGSFVSRYSPVPGAFRALCWVTRYCPGELGDLIGVLAVLRHFNSPFVASSSPRSSPN